MCCINLPGGWVRHTSPYCFTVRALVNHRLVLTRAGERFPGRGDEGRNPGRWAIPPICTLQIRATTHNSPLDP